MQFTNLIRTSKCANFIIHSMRPKGQLQPDIAEANFTFLHDKCKEKSHTQLPKYYHTQYYLFSIWNRNKSYKNTINDRRKVHITKINYTLYFHYNLNEVSISPQEFKFVFYTDNTDMYFLIVGRFHWWLRTFNLSPLSLLKHFWHSCSTVTSVFNRLFQKVLAAPLKEEPLF